MKISVVIPCYCSSKSLESVVRETGEVLSARKGVEYEIVLVNDGSPDDTMDTIRALCKDEHVKGINLAKNFGQACATIAGLAHVTGDIVLYSDDDGQTPIDHAWTLIDKLNEGHDIVFADFEVKKNSAFQNFGTKVNNMMATFLIGKPKDLHFGNFWCCRRFVVDEVVKCQNPYPYLGGLFVNITKNMTSVQTSHRERLHGKTSYTFAKMFALWLNGFTAFSVKPLRLATIMGFLFSAFGFLFAAYIAVQKLIHPTIPVGYSSIMATLLIIGGLIMFMLGLIGEYVGRIYMNINRIPQYVVKDKTNL